MGAFDAIQYVTGIFSLLAFFAATISVLVAKHIGRTEGLIKSAPEGKRARLVEAALEGFTVDTQSLTKKQKYDLLCKQMEHKAARWTKAFRYLVVLTISLFLAFVATQAFNADSGLRTYSSAAETIGPSAINPKVEGELLIVLFTINNASLAIDIRDGIKAALRRYDPQKKIRVENVGNTPSVQERQEYADALNADLLISGARTDSKLMVEVNFNLNASTNKLTLIYPGDFRNSNPKWYVEFSQNELNKILAVIYQLYVDKGTLDYMFEKLAQDVFSLDDVIPSSFALSGNLELLNKINKLKYEFAKYLYETGKPNYADRAISILSSLIEENDEKSADLRLLRGKIFLHFMMFEEALTDYNEAILIDENAWEAWLGRAKVAALLGNEDIAKKSTLKASELNPEIVTSGILLAKPPGAGLCAGYEKAYALSTLHRYDEAIKTFTNLLSNNCELHEIYYERGIAYLKNDQFSYAQDDFEKYLEERPKSSIGHYELGNTMVSLEKYDLAIAAYKKAIEYFYPFEIDDNENKIRVTEVPAFFLGQIYSNLGWAFEHSGDDTSAITSYERALKLLKEHRSVTTSVQLGLAYARAKRFDESLAAFDKALKYAPGHPEILSLKQEALKKSLDIYE